jgi:hypothetical protein
MGSPYDVLGGPTAVASAGRRDQTSKMEITEPDVWSEATVAALYDSHRLDGSTEFQRRL